MRALSFGKCSSFSGISRKNVRNCPSKFKFSWFLYVSCLNNQFAIGSNCYFGMLIGYSIIEQDSESDTNESSGNWVPKFKAFLLFFWDYPQFSIIETKRHLPKPPQRTRCNTIVQASVLLFFSLLILTKQNSNFVTNESPKFCFNFCNKSYSFCLQKDVKHVANSTKKSIYARRRSHFFLIS